MYFPLAISNLFAGLYIEQICLACLFYLNVKEDEVPSIIQGSLAVVLLVFTLGAQIMFSNAFKRKAYCSDDPFGRALIMFTTAIYNYLPMSLATKKMAKRFEKRTRKLQGLAEVEEEIDLFSRQRE